MSELMDFQIPEANNDAIIKVVGVGGGGGNAVNHMYHEGIKDVEFMICNTDAQALKNSDIPIRIQLGASLTEGRGAGNEPEVGRESAKESYDKVKEILSNNTKMVFVTAGMGGGTGTGAAPVIAEISRELDILTVGIVTIPFKTEGKKRQHQALAGIRELREHVDSLLVINNERIKDLFGDFAVSEAFKKADGILSTAAKGIAEIITVTGFINVDFADVVTVMKDSGVAIMGSSMASGENRATMAIEEALNSPLLNDNNIKGAKNILVNIYSGTPEATMSELSAITEFVQESAGFDADLIWGNGKDESLGDNLRVTVIATGFDDSCIPTLDEPKKKVTPTPPKPPQVAPVNENITVSSNPSSYSQNPSTQPNVTNVPTNAHQPDWQAQKAAQQAALLQKQVAELQAQAARAERAAEVARAAQNTQQWNNTQQHQAQQVQTNQSAGGYQQYNQNQVPTHSQPANNAEWGQPNTNNPAQQADSIQESHYQQRDTSPLADRYANDFQKRREEHQPIDQQTRNEQTNQRDLDFQHYYGEENNRNNNIDQATITQLEEQQFSQTQSPIQPVEVHIPPVPPAPQKIEPEANFEESYEEEVRPRSMSRSFQSATEEELDEVESIPAYLRRRVKKGLAPRDRDTRNSESKNRGPQINPNNRYLHDNVD